jgi:hypothetical protein
VTPVSEPAVAASVFPVPWCRSVETALRTALELERFRLLELEAVVPGEPFEELVTVATACIVAEAHSALATELLAAILTETCLPTPVSIQTSSIPEAQSHNTSIYVCNPSFHSPPFVIMHTIQYVYMHKNHLNVAVPHVNGKTMWERSRSRGKEKETETSMSPRFSVG